MINVAKATEATHSGLGRQKKEGRSKVRSAVSLLEAKKRKKKEKKRRESRERSKERTQTRKASKSCKEGFLAKMVLEKQGLVDSLVGNNLGDAADAVDRLTSAVLEGKSSFDNFEECVSKMCSELDTEALNSALGSFGQMAQATQDISLKFQPETIDSVTRSLHNISNAFKNELPGRLDDLNDNIKGLRDDLNSGSWFDNIVKKLNLSENADLAINVAIFLAVFYSIVSGDARPQMVLSLLALAKAFLSGTSKFLPVVQVLSATMVMLGQRMPVQNDDIEAQGGFEKSLYTVGIVGLCSILLSIPWKKTEELVGRLGKLMPALSRFDSAIKGMKSFVDYMLSGFQVVADWITNKLGIEKLELKSDPYFFIEEYVAKVFRLRDQFTSGTRDQSVLWLS